jgi:hypothetical protein
MKSVKPANPTPENTANILPHNCSKDKSSKKKQTRPDKMIIIANQSTFVDLSPRNEKPNNATYIGAAYCISMTFPAVVILFPITKQMTIKA